MSYDPKIYLVPPNCERYFYVRHDAVYFQNPGYKVHIDDAIANPYWHGIVCAVAYMGWMKESERIGNQPANSPEFWKGVEARRNAAAWLEPLLRGAIPPFTAGVSSMAISDWEDRAERDAERISDLERDNAALRAEREAFKEQCLKSAKEICHKQLVIEKQERQLAALRADCDKAFKKLQEENRRLREALNKINTAIPNHTCGEICPLCKIISILQSVDAVLSAPKEDKK